MATEIDFKELIREMTIYYSGVEGDVHADENTLHWTSENEAMLKGMREMIMFVDAYSKGNIP